jgi:biotin operon repressor
MNQNNVENVYMLIEAYIQKFAMSPSYADIANEMGMSRTAINNAVNQLEEEGRLKSHRDSSGKRIARSIQLALT